METLGEKIRKSRNAKGLSQKKLADLLGIQYQSVQDWERDKTKPSTGKIPKLCEILDVSSTWLLSSKGTPYSEEKKISILKSPVQYGLQQESSRHLKLFEKLQPETQKVVIKLMEALIKGNRRF
ncbi:MAG: helix-turn-helix domain-containing protein [Deltaproteobacteria bacterium]|nr:helix-turn-helix domain-containing protein [Deltaproteobacteria bacterium]